MKVGPFIRSKNSTHQIMNRVLFALIPIILFSFYKNGIIPFLNNNTNIYGMLKPLIFVLLGALFTYVLERLGARFFLKKKDKELDEYMKNSFSILPGIFLSLVLPINTPIWVLLFGSIITVFLGKMIYGGFGNNIFNPALVGCLFTLTIYSGVILSNGGYLNSYEVDTISSATPLSNAKVIGIGTYEELVEPYGNLNNFLFGFIPGTIGETSALLCIIAYIYLCYKKVIKKKIPILYVGTVFILTWIIGHINGLSIWYPVFQILSGGLLFGAVFMATDPVTSPVTPIGQFIYSIGLGILTVVFRHITPYPEGVLTSILTMNMLVPILDNFGSIARGKIKKYSIVFIIIILLGIGIANYIGNNYKNPKKDSDFEIIEVIKQENSTIYTVSQKGNGGPIKAKVTVEKNIITNIEILSQNETPSYYKKVEEEKFISKLINNKNIDEVDTVSGATITSKALKQMALNVLKENS